MECHNRRVGIVDPNAVRLRSEVRKVLSQLPDPNLSGAANNYSILQESTNHSDKAGGKIDVTMSPVLSMFGRYGWRKLDAIDQPPIPLPAGGGGNGNIYVRNKQLALGMTYIHIPVDFQNPTDQDFDQFCSIMEQLKEVPVHVHCIANYRVSAFFYRYRRDVLGMDEAEARADMEDVWHPEGVWATFVGR